MARPPIPIDRPFTVATSGITESGVSRLRALKTHVEVEGNRSVAMKFTDGDAGTIINIIGEVSFRD
jgi:hypothetical protein